MPYASRMKLSFITLVVLLTFLFTASLLGTAPRALAAASSLHLQAAPPATNLANYVNPFTGTGVQPGAPFGGGDTFPGADVPFGLVQWSPDTENYNSGGYWYPDNRIAGFSLTHLNGAGCSTFSDIPFIPYVGAVTTSPASTPMQYISTFSHNNESANAGYYQVTLDNGIHTELTATQRSGAGRFTYPAGKTATMLVNVSGSINGVSDAQANVGSNTISGWASSGNFCNAGDVYRVYFWAQFSQPFATVGTWHNSIVTPNSTTTTGGSQAAPAVHQAITAQSQIYKSGKTATRVRAAAQSHPNVSVSGPGSGAFVTFNTSKTTAISVRVGLSFVSIANAQANVNQEDAHGNFDQVHQQATQTWNRWLGEIQVSGGTATQLSTFYTAMYHVLLQPNVFSDVNGQYIGFDGQIHTVARGHAKYANYSGWDIYRSEVPMLALLAPQETSDIIQSMVYDYQQSGQLPKWTLANAETYVMVGDPADPIIAGAYAFGARNFDTKAALAAMIKEATQTNNVRPGLNYLDSMGYMPSNGSYGCCNFYGPASTTLEYNTADFSIGALAQALGDTENYQKFQTRAQNWENLDNVADGALEPRYLDGSFIPAFNPSSPTGWVESNGAQYNWMVPFNLRGLFDSEGGNAKVNQQLDTFFTQLNAGPNMPYAFLGNEPTIETPWEYDYAGTPYKTQKVVRTTENTLWMPGPEGMAGNDDLGTMSAWYVFAALGMFPETPGSANLVLTSPLFPSMTLHRPSGQTIRINAPGASADTYYIQSLKVNGQSSTKPWLPSSFVQQGGTLDFTLSNTPNTSWGAAATDAPPSFQYGQQPVLLSSSRAVVAPGNTTQTSVLEKNIGTSTASGSWTATASSGLTITPSSGTFTTQANGISQQPVVISAAANMAEGYYTVSFTSQNSAGTKLSPLTIQVVVAKPGNPLPYYNNIGISNDSNSGAADFDGDGFSYSMQLLAQAGFTPGSTTAVNGINYTWPNVGAGTYDNIEASGQAIPLPTAKAGATQLSFLGSATNGPSQGTITITYADGTKATAQLGFSDWTLNAGGQPASYNNVIAAKTAYRNSTNGTADRTTTYLFASAPISLDSSKQVASVTLPSTVSAGALHVFAIAVS